MAVFFLFFNFQALKISSLFSNNLRRTARRKSKPAFNLRTESSPQRSYGCFLMVFGFGGGEAGLRLAWAENDLWNDCAPGEGNYLQTEGNEKTGNKGTRKPEDTGFLNQRYGNSVVEGDEPSASGKAGGPGERQRATGYGEAGGYCDGALCQAGTGMRVTKSKVSEVRAWAPGTEIALSSEPQMGIQTFKTEFRVEQPPIRPSIAVRLERLQLALTNIRMHDKTVTLFDRFNRF